MLTLQDLIDRWDGNELIFLPLSDPPKEHEALGKHNSVFCHRSKWNEYEERMRYMAFKVNAKRQEDGSYKLSFGKGKQKIEAMCGKDQDGKWLVMLEPDGTFICDAQDKMADCKEAFHDYAIKNYKGELSGDQQKHRAASLSQQSQQAQGSYNPHQPAPGTDPNNPLPLHKAIHPGTGQNMAVTGTLRPAIALICDFAQEFAPIYLKDDPQGLEAVAEAVRGIRNDLSL